MAVLLLNQPVDLPIARLRRTLTQLAPLIAWRIGDDDDGSKDQIVAFDRPQTILARSGDEMMMITLERVATPYQPANGHCPPAHRLHVRIGRPTLGEDALARRLQLAIATTLAVCGDEGAHLQLDPGENWLDVTDMRSLFRTLGSDPELNMRNHYGRAEGQRMEATTPAANPARTVEGANPAGRLGSFTFLLDGEVSIDWARIDEAMNTIDPGGKWHSIAVPTGLGFTAGRAKIVAIWSPVPYDPQPIESAYGRSFWFDGDKARVARHRQYITIQVETPESHQARVQTAKAVTIMVGLIAQLPQVAAVFNNMVSTLFSPANVHGLVGVLHMDEVPVGLWTWCAPNRLEDGNVSISTGGMEPFVGYEVEVWNAPHPVAYVGDKLNGVLRYLLINGPVVAHGDTIGVSSGDQSVRCFFGPSRADRPAPVKVMLLEFDVNRPDSPPRKDLPLPPTIRPGTGAEPRPAASPNLATPVAAGAPRRPVFGRKGV